MKKLHFRKGQISIVGVIIVAVFIFMALGLIFNRIWFGVFFLFPAAVIFSVREGVYIDVEKRMYKSYLSICGITPAQWKPIPEGTKIGIRILKLVANRRIGLVQMDSTVAGSTLELYLYTPKPERIVITTNDNVKKLYQQAQFIRQHLGYEVVVDNRISTQKYLA